MSYHRILPRPDTWGSEPPLIDHAQATSDPVQYQPSNGAVFKAYPEEMQVDFRSEAFAHYCQRYLPVVAAANRGLLPPAITRIVQEQWNRLSQAERNQWPILSEIPNYEDRQCRSEDEHQSRVKDEDNDTRWGSSVQGYTNPVEDPRITSVVQNGTCSPTSLPPFTSLFLDVNDSFGQSTDLRSTKDLSDGGPMAVAHSWDAPLHQPQYDSDTMRDHSLDTHNIQPGPSSNTQGCNRQSLTSFTHTSSGEHSDEDMLRTSPLIRAPQKPRAHAQYEHTQSQPLTATGPASTPEITAKLLSVFNKIGTLAYGSPPINPAFQKSGSRGPVISVDGQDSLSVKSIIDYLHSTLPMEGFRTRVFKGPEARPRHMSRRKYGPIVEYLNNVSAWHPISAQVVDYIQHPYRGLRAKAKRGDDLGNGSVPVSRDTGYPLPVALIARYQLTTVDAFACEISVDDPYSQTSHQQWMESLWRGCVGPDIVVYIQDHETPEMGSSQDLVYSARLQDTLGIVIPRAKGSAKEPKERVLRHVVWAIDSIVMSARAQ
ncbi:hypothetical protein ANOM_004262 [Aspergillus nomiae NRRL 13137]|uniref:HMG box domain-containing protein n=1 Tax=Aspergillus nomiae NRRL (strain ATCC 15546 / NRRL 13137 / CBS 260.88 / M93) TaxID=1509407 RepID=A0A0L1J6U5_ASPN3|nr:uncharacterized protein ANOM_004262 [Aspergillus nomiae NRRL 13137]KNG87449.1 hypothetical protein ANOM_004262 [Aspergillus nomiae NRRL 13137]